MGKRLNLIFLFCLVPFYLKFFEARFINATFLNISHFLFCSVAIAVSVNKLFMDSRTFGFSVRMIFFSVVLSMFMAYIYWGQSILESVIATAPLMIWILFFFLVASNTRIKDLELIAVIYGLVYVALYFYQYMNSGTVLFGSKDEYSYDRGVIRIYFPGSGMFQMAVFIGLNKMTMQGRGRSLWILLSVLGLAITVMQVTRQDIFYFFLIYTYHLLRDLGLIKKLILLIVILLSVGMIYNSDILVIKELKSSLSTDKELGRENIRYVAGEFFLSQFSPAVIPRIFGNGQPYGPSAYGLYVAGLQSNYGFFLSDVGLIGLYTMFGVFAVLAYLIVWYKSIVIRIPKQYRYVKYFLWHSMITSLTSDSVFSTNQLLATVFVLYIFEKSLMDSSLPT